MCQISMWEYRSPLISHEEKIKTWMENSTRNADKNLQKHAKMIKQRKNAGICRSKKEKVTQEK